MVITTPVQGLKNPTMVETSSTRRACDLVPPENLHWTALSEETSSSFLGNWVLHSSKPLQVSYLLATFLELSCSAPTSRREQFPQLEQQVQP